MFVRFFSVIQTTIYWLYIRFSLKNFVSGSRHFSLILIYSFYWCTLHCINNRREIINEIERNSQWKKRRVYFCLFFSLFCWLTQKRIWRKRKKKKLTEVARIIEENNKDYLGLLAFEISFVWYCCEDTVKERSSSFLELIKYYDNRSVMMMI